MSNTTQPREAFQEWLRGRSAGEYKGTMNDIVTMEAGHHDLKTIITMLWDCKDPLPPAACEKANVPAGSSYSYAVRSERQWLDRRR